MHKKKRNQRAFREDFTTCLVDWLDDNEYFELADAVLGEFEEDMPDGLDKAKREVYYELQAVLKGISRLGVRLEYLEKGV